MNICEAILFMQYTAAGYFIDKIQSQNLYNKDIETFFLRHHIYKCICHRKELLSDKATFSPEAVLYVRAGRFKIYMGTIDGDNVFVGYLPQYSILAIYDNSLAEAKFNVADVDSTVYAAHMDDYLRFLQTSPELIYHQMQEPYTRRNANDFSRNDTIGHVARIKVSEFLLCTCLRFGMAEGPSGTDIAMKYPPTIADIASYTGTHRTNVSRLISELQKNGYLTYTKDKLTIHDVEGLSTLIEEGKEGKSGA